MANAFLLGSSTDYTSLQLTFRIIVYDAPIYRDLCGYQLIKAQEDIWPKNLRLLLLKVAVGIARLGRAKT